MKLLKRICTLLFFIVSSYLSSYGQWDAIEFERFSVENGLSQNTIYAIIQDSRGFMWFGTENGL
ncbi:MAG: two-component regulator propeller domain-containing protein, partial [Tenuifilaceae bacterium]